MGIETAALIGAIATATAAATSVGSTAYSVHNQREAKKDAKSAAKDQALAQRKLEGEAKDRLAKDESSRVRDQARAQQLAAAKNAQGFESTIRTSKFGVPNDDSTYLRKVALGL